MTRGSHTGNMAGAKTQSTSRPNPLVNPVASNPAIWTK